VTDASGGVLPGVQITIGQDATGLTRVATTDLDGRFMFPALTVGRYDLRAELAGLEVRLEAFNIFNRANFGDPTLIASTGSADNEQPQASLGRIRSTVTASRQMQIGARIVF
jgi:carboxypeptidase family protein